MELIKKYKQLFIIPQIFIIILLLNAFAYNPYSYYIFLRWAIFLVMLFNLYNYIKRMDKSFFVFVAILIIYNPIRPVYLTREIWSVINLVTIISILITIYWYLKEIKKVN
ncbi:MAG TPA: hypothetical protein PK762_12490 [Candidatus Kapabacteria bacterium]|nr:hypothetical protein [Candidatus Kapabacteria bacterium]